jgi:DNA-binding NarL/FixJ family response regulator
VTIPNAVGPTPIRVLLVDDHSVVRLGLAAVLSAERDILVVGEAGDGAEAITAVERLRPDVVVMDLSMDGLDGMAATRRIASAGDAAPRVLVLTMHDEQEYLIPLLDAGASGYIVKSAAGRELLTAIRTVAAGRVYVRPDAAPVLALGFARRASAADGTAAYRSLSEREQHVFRLFAQGYTSGQIGERLNISPKTVDTYRRRVNEKTGLVDRADYVRVALELGLLAAPRE